MNYFDDANHLVQFAKDHYAGIEVAYKFSLSEKEIKPNLLIEIKNFMENLRSALDFTAHGLFQKYGSSSTLNPKIYFPYAYLSQSKEGFQKSRRVDVCIPGLSIKRPDVIEKIESYQHFTNPRNRWLPVFMDLNNENKHQQLTPQFRKEAKELRISSSGTSMSIGPGASISVGSGASIQIGNIVIPGGQSFDANNPPLTLGAGKKEIITWVSFHFSTNDEPVFPFLKQALVGIDKRGLDQSKHWFRIFGTRAERVKITLSENGTSQTLVPLLIMLSPSR
jgi:hypothetical protein